MPVQKLSWKLLITMLWLKNWILLPWALLGLLPKTLINVSRGEVGFWLIWVKIVTILNISPQILMSIFLFIELIFSGTVLRILLLIIEVVFKKKIKIFLKMFDFVKNLFILHTIH